MLLPSKSWRPNVRLPAMAGSMMSKVWRGASSSSSAADAAWPARWWKIIESRSKSLEMAQEKTPLSLASIESWWSKLLSASRMARPRSRCTAAIDCDRLLPTFCSYKNKTDKEYPYFAILRGKREFISNVGTEFTSAEDGPWFDFPLCWCRFLPRIWFVVGPLSSRISSMTLSWSWICFTPLMKPSGLEYVNRKFFCRYGRGMQSNDWKWLWQSKEKYVRLFREIAKNVVHFAVNLGHFTLYPPFCLTETRFQQRHLFACYSIIEAI